MGSSMSGEVDQTWLWIGAVGLIGLILGLILLFAVENKAVGAIITIISIIILIIAAYLWWMNSRNKQLNNF